MAARDFFGRAEGVRRAVSDTDQGNLYVQRAVRAASVRRARRATFATELRKATRRRARSARAWLLRRARAAARETHSAPPARVAAQQIPQRCSSMAGWYCGDDRCRSAPATRRGVALTRVVPKCKGSQDARRAHLRASFKRRGRDSNPRYGYPHTGFRNRPDRPLRHLSGHRTQPLKVMRRRMRVHRDAGEYAGAPAKKPARASGCGQFHQPSSCDGELE